MCITYFYHYPGLKSRWSIHLQSVLPSPPLPAPAGGLRLVPDRGRLPLLLGNC